LEGVKGYLKYKLVKVLDPSVERSYSIVENLGLTNWDLVYYEQIHQVYIFVHKDYELTIMDAELKTVLKRANLTENGVQSTDEYFVHIAYQMIITLFSLQIIGSLY
jgi:hypothetical protein